MLKDDSKKIKVIVNRSECDDRVFYVEDADPRQYRGQQIPLNS
jgi:hypothetical protein